MSKMGTSWLIAAKWTLFIVALILFLFRDGNCQNMQQNNNNLERVHYRTIRGNNKVCGTELTELVAFVCSNYKPKAKPKRMYFRQVHPKIKAIYDPVDFEDYDEEDNMVLNKAMPDQSIDYQGVFLKKIYGGVMIPTWKNGKRFRSERESLTQECCYKSCSHNELLGYCDGKGGYRGMND